MTRKPNNAIVLTIVSGWVAAYACLPLGYINGNRKMAIEKKVMCNHCGQLSLVLGELFHSLFKNKRLIVKNKKFDRGEQKFDRGETMLVGLCPQKKFGTLMGVTVTNTQTHKDRTMSQVTMIGCDLHDRSMLLQVAVGRGKPRQLDFRNDAKDRCKMITALKRIADQEGNGKIVYVYEASGLGHGLSDQLDEAGIECHVLSPNQLPKTPKSAKLKTDAKDAMMLLEQVRGYVLTGNSMPAVWTPPKQLRADRELVRARIDNGDEITRVKLKLKSFMKVNQLHLECPTTKLWTKGHLRKIRKVLLPHLDFYLATKFELLLNRLEYYQQEQLALDQVLKRLSQHERYVAPCHQLRQIPGVGLLVAMTFLTEMGDLNRFNNRREVAAYLGLCPASNESGTIDDRKGRITRQGPARLRKMLCQAAWVSIQHCNVAAESYQRIRQDQQKRTKKALVALMRKLAIKMWHQAMSMGVSPELEGRGGPNTLMDFVETSTS